MSDSGRFKQFENYFISFCLGFWSPEIIDLPYGDYVLFDPCDEASMLFKANLNKASFENIVSEIIDISKQKSVQPSFRISPSWQGDIQEFQSYIQQKDFSLSQEIINFYIDDFSHIQCAQNDTFTAAETQDVELIMKHCFELF